MTDDDNLSYSKQLLCGIDAEACDGLLLEFSFLTSQKIRTECFFLQKQFIRQNVSTIFPQTIILSQHFILLRKI